MAINIDGKTYRNLQQQVLQNMNDIQEIKEQGTGETYSAGTGINISDENVISIDNTVATKADIPTYTEGQGIIITNSNEIKANIGYGLEFSATESDTDEIKIDIDVVATKEDIPTVPTKTSQLTNDSGFITIADVPVPTAGAGIDITNATISVDNTVALKIDLPHLYQHNIVGMTNDTEDFALFSFINTTSTAMTFNQVREWLYDNGFVGDYNGLHYLPASGRCSADSFEFDYTPVGQSTTSAYCESVVVGVRATNSDDNYIKVLVSRLKEKDSGTDAYEEDYISMQDSFTDTVITLC